MKITVLFLSVLIGFSSCMTQKPKTIGLKDYGKNNIKVVERPHYKKSLSLIGKGALAGSLAGGAIGGLTLQPTINYNAQGERTTNTLMNGLIGGSVGIGITSIYSVMKGLGKRQYINNENEFRQWLDKYNRRKIGTEYVYTGFSNYLGYLVLPNNRSTEKNYVVNLVEDAIMFKNAFPYSSRNKEFEAAAANQIWTRADAALFLHYYPNSSYRNSVLAKLRKFEADAAAASRAREQARTEQLGNIIIGGVIVAAVIKGLYDLVTDNNSNSNNSSSVGDGLTDFTYCTQPTGNTTDLYVLTIGTDPEVYADKDAVALVQKFKESCGKKDLFGDIYTMTLTDRNATKANILDALRRMNEKTNQDDIFLVFFSGHGGNRDINGNIIPFIFGASGGGNVTFDEIIDNLQADDCKTIFWFDACHAGQVKNDFINNIDDYIKNKNCPNVSILMSSRDNEGSYPDGNSKLGYFTKAILDGLDGAADANKNRIVSLKELVDYVEETVPKRVPKDKQQHPQSLKAGRDPLNTRLSKY